MNNKYFSNAIHHVAIICRNYEMSKHFYSQILGFPIIHEAYRESRKSYKLDLAVNNTTQVELFSFENPPARPSTPEACGLRHLAFAVEEIDECVGYLLSQGVECEPIRIDEFTNKRFTFFKDPDDLPLEIYEITTI